MDVTFEYIAATLVIFILLGFAIFTVTSLTTTQVDLLGQQQLFPVAQQAVDKILLTRGEPLDWGENITVNGSLLVDFGLAAASPHTDAYDLDINKVMRLVQSVGTVTNALYLDPTSVGSLMGIYTGSYWNYGFRLYMVPALNVTITVNDTASHPLAFVVNVKNAQGVPARNAFVQVKYFDFYVYKDTGGGPAKDVFDWSSVFASAYTDYAGNASLTFSSAPSPAQGVVNPQEVFVVTVSADYYGLEANSILELSTVPSNLDMLIEGQYLIGNFTGVTGIPKSANQLQLEASVIELTDNLNVILNPATNVTTGNAGYVFNQGGKNYKVFQLVNPVSENVILAGLMVKTTGQSFFAVAFRPVLPVALDYRSHAVATAGLQAITIERLVHMGRNSYVVDLTIWRMVI